MAAKPKSTPAPDADPVPFAGLTGFARITQPATRTATVSFPIDPNDVDRLAKAGADLNAVGAKLGRARLTANTNPDDAVAAEAAATLEAEYVDAEEALTVLEESVPRYTLHFRKITPEQLADVQFDNRATKEQKSRANALGDPVPRIDEVRYPAGLVVAACTKITYSDDPDNPTLGPITEPMALQLAALWSDQDRGYVMRAVQTLALGSTVLADLGKG